jgi:hypothetical protein
MSIDFKLDRTAFATLSFEDADKAISRFPKHTWKERLIIAKHLTAVAYNYPVNNPPKMDKTFFEIHQHNG